MVCASAALVCGCGGGDEQTVTSTAATSSTTTTAAPADRGPAAVSSCGEAGAAWRPLKVKLGSQQLHAATLGRGRIGFVFANDSGNSTCKWLPFARRLTDRGDRVAVFQYSSVGNPAELRATATAVRAAGAERIVAVGASVGGRAVVELAAKQSPGVDAVVSLSGEREIGPQYPDILPDARRVELPILYAGSRKDGYTSFGKETVQLHEATPADLNELLLVPGSDHGVDLLSGPEGPRVRAAILSFAARAVGQD
jgi:pimeloyl-ACP methyl ester carboxylesterase